MVEPWEAGRGGRVVADEVVDEGCGADDEGPAGVVAGVEPDARAASTSADRPFAGGFRPGADILGGICKENRWLYSEQH